METLKKLFDIVRHLDKYLDQITRDYGSLTYGILAAIVFAETGLVVTPFLPGDSLLFACGAVSMREGSGLSPIVLGPILIAAALAGDNVNYQVGKAIGPRVMKSETSRWLNKRHLDKTHKFFEKYGGKTIILARFVPIVRTFAPFVAGAGAMNFRQFIVYSVAGATLWVTTMMGAGMIFGQMRWVQDHFEAVVLGIIVISVMPMVVEWWRVRKAPPDLTEAEPKPKADAAP